MITRTVKQLKVFDIKSRQDVIHEQGMQPWLIPGLSWVNAQPWESAEECDRLYAEACEDWKRRRAENPWGTTSHKPELVVYWQIIDIDENTP